MGIGWSDYTVSCSFRTVDYDFAGFLIRASDKGNFYLFNVRYATDPISMAILPFEDGSPLFGKRDEIDISDAIPADATDDWHDIEIEASGDQFDVAINGIHQTTYTDQLHDKGRIGFRTGVGGDQRVDDVRVVDPEGNVLFETSFDDPEESNLIDDGVLKIPGETISLWPPVGETASARIKMESPDGQRSYSDPIETDSTGQVIRETGWIDVPPAFNGGNLILQLQAGGGSAVEVSAVTLETAIQNKI
jgi:hypothetical protein